MNDSYSSFLDLLIGLPQGSVVPLLFNIYICDLLFFVEEEIVTSYADDTTLFFNETSIQF